VLRIDGGIKPVSRGEHVSRAPGKPLLSQYECQRRGRGEGDIGLQKIVLQRSAVRALPPGDGVRKVELSALERETIMEGELPLGSQELIPRVHSRERGQCPIARGDGILAEDLQVPEEHLFLGGKAREACQSHQERSRCKGRSEKTNRQPPLSRQRRQGENR